MKSKNRRRHLNQNCTPIENGDQIVHGNNDPVWYAKNPELLLDGFSLATNNMLGTPLKLNKIGPIVGVPDGTETRYIPGICTIHVTPCPGIARSANSPVNVAAWKLFTNIRKRTTGSNVYEPADLMMYVLGLDNCYMLWNFMYRAHGVLNLYNQANRYLPRYLIQAMNLDFGDLSTHQAEFRSLINKMGSILQQFAMPKGLAYFERHSWLFQNIYRDTDSLKSQLYMYVPSVLFTWKEDVEAGKLPSLVPVPITRGTTSNILLNLKALQQLVDSLTQPMLRSGDMNTMSGDITRAYGPESLVSVKSCTDEEQITPIYSEEVLMQIENTAAIAESDHSQAIEQTNEGYIKYIPECSLGWANTREQILMNFHKDGVSASDVAVATRLIPALDVTDIDMTNYKGSFIAVGSEIPDVIQYWTINPNDVTKCYVQYANRADCVTSADNKVSLIVTMSNFRCHPLFEVFTSDSGDSTNPPLTSQGTIGDLNNYTIVDTKDLLNMHEVALLSLFDVPFASSK